MGKTVSLIEKILTSVDEKVAFAESTALEGKLNGIKSLMDFGCGSGIVGKALSEKFGILVVGTDISDTRKVNIKFKKTDGVKIPFSDKTFDAVLMSYVLHHTIDAIPLINEAKRVGKKKIFIFEDTPENFWQTLLSFIHGFSFKWYFKLKDDFSFRTDLQWKLLFKKLKIKMVESKKIICFNPVYNPCRRLYVLEID